jgi:hypothetical protein
MLSHLKEPKKNFNKFSSWDFFFSLFYMKIQTTKNTGVRAQKKKISARGPQNPLRGLTHFWSGSIKKNFFDFLLFDSCRAYQIIAYSINILSKIEEMGPFLVKSWLFQKMSILVVISFLLTPIYQQGSVRKFWKFARLLNLIWAFRKKTFQVDQREPIFWIVRFLRQCLLNISIFWTRWSNLILTSKNWHFLVSTEP